MILRLIHVNECIILLLFLKNVYLFLLPQVLVVACGLVVVACGLLSCGLHAGSSPPTRD